MNEINARANVAARDEDLRIATKHRIEAAARELTPENARAYEAAIRWEETCNEARRLAGCHLRDVLAKVPPRSTEETIERAGAAAPQPPSSTEAVISGVIRRGDGGSAIRRAIERSARSSS